MNILIDKRDPSDEQRRMMDMAERLANATGEDLRNIIRDELRALREEMDEVLRRLNELQAEREGKESKR